MEKSKGIFWPTQHNLHKQILNEPKYLETLLKVSLSPPDISHP